MNFTVKRILPKEDGEYIQKLLSMTGKEIYDQFGFKRDEIITETVSFSDTGYEMDIKCVIPVDEEETPWTEAVLFYNGFQVAYTDVEDKFFDTWELEDDGHNFIVVLKYEEEKDE